MGRFKTPQQKKTESFKHDRVENGEYPHADRRNRPLTKALWRRKLRRTSKQLLSYVPEEVLQLPKRPERTWQKTSEGLPEYLERTERNRIERTAQNLFRRGYGPAAHARFRRVVESWMEGSSTKSATLADFYCGVLNGFADEFDHLRCHGRLSERRYFVAEFFRKEPELKRRFESWISALHGPPKSAQS
jgi:hypothetical protein